MRYHHSMSSRKWDRCQWKSTSYSPKLQNYKSLTIRLFIFISHWRSFTSLQRSRWFANGSVWSLCTTWALTKRMEKKLDGDYTRMLRAILNRSWRQHLTRQQLYGHLPPIRKTIKMRRTIHAEHCWRSRNELVSDVLQWTPAQGRAKAGRPARNYIQQLCADKGCNPEDLLKAMYDWEV